MSRPVRKYSSPKCFCLTWLVLFTWYRNGIKCESITILKKINLEICEFDFVWQVSLSQMIGSNGFWPNIKWSIAQLLDFKSLFLKATQHKIIRILFYPDKNFNPIHCNALFWSNPKDMVPYKKEWHGKMVHGGSKYWYQAF